MNTMLTTLGTQAEFHQTWQAMPKTYESTANLQEGRPTCHIRL